MKNINQIVSESDANRVHTLLTARKKPFASTLQETEAQYNPKEHKVFDTTYRKKKVISVPSGKKDPITGKEIYKNKNVERVRIAIPVQKTIVERAVGFLFGIPVEYKMTQNGQEVKNATDNQQKLFDSVKIVYHQNKMKYFDKRLARTVFRAKEAAELWYMPTDNNGKIDKGGKMRARMLSPLEGDKLYPHFNDLGNMDGFAREYKILDEEGNSMNHFDVYTDTLVYQYISEGDGWKLEKVVQHGFNKVPVIYYRQQQAEWEDVQWAIERLEDCVSNWGDTNDYFGTPKYFVKGKLKGFAEKGEQGSVFEGEKETDMRVLSWDSSPQSVTGEIAELLSIIFSYTHSADISFERMKELGNNTSGAAIRLMFTDPHMNAQVKTELFGEMFTRRSNIVADGICHTGIVTGGIPENTAKEVNFEPVFKPFMPKNELEEMQLITQSVGGKSSTSRKRAIAINPLNDDPVRIEKEMEEEEQAELQQAMAAMSVGGSSNSAAEA